MEKEKIRFKVFAVIGLTILMAADCKKNKNDGSGDLKKDCFSCSNAPAGTIFCDDFESEAPLADRYFEYDDNGGDFIRVKGAGRDSSAGMRVRWQQGEVDAGGLAKSFGRTPDNYIGNHASRPTENFKEIYWRMDVKMQSGWTGGGPAKFFRATTLANSNWAQGMMAHVWSDGNYLSIDPASGIDVNGNLVSTHYNDFANLRWLGPKTGTTDLFSNANAGKWYCVIAHAKLNTPGQSDGVFEFWIDDVPQARMENMNWHGNWNASPDNYMINTIFFENFWNDGSPKLQERNLDNILISANPIKCKCAE